MPKTNFFYMYKNRSNFSKPNQIFLSQHRSEFFNKEEDAFINRLMRFSFSCVQHIIHVMHKKGTLVMRV